MNSTPLKPKIVVSSCLGFEATRYNGAMLDNAFVRKLRETKTVEFITVCPEVAIGLGVPRETLRLVMKNGEKHIIQPKTEKDVTKDMLKFTKEFTEDLIADGFIFKADSPSVGTDHVKVYPGEEAFVGKRGGAGFFTEQIIMKFTNYPIQSDRRLKNPNIQDSFLTKVYTLARFRQQVSDKIKSLISFHKKNYFLLLSHSPKLALNLEKMVRNSSPNPKLNETYYFQLLEVLKDGANRENTLIALEELIKKLEKKLTKKELNYVKTKLEQFKINAISKYAIFSVLEVLAINKDYKEIFEQTIFNPYPLHLVIWEDKLQDRFLVNAYDSE